jgi:hypothetical protein
MNVPLDEQILVWPQTAHILPLIIRTISHIERLSHTILVYQRAGVQVLLEIDTGVVAHSEWHIPCWVRNRAPQVDDLVPFLYELSGFFSGQVSVDASLSSSGCLVNVCKPRRLALG